MDVVILLVFVSLVLVSLGLVLFISRLRDGDFEHAERLSLLPLAEDESRPSEGDGAPGAAGESMAGAGEPAAGAGNVEAGSLTRDDASPSPEGGLIHGRR